MIGALWKFALSDGKDGRQAIRAASSLQSTEKGVIGESIPTCSEGLNGFLHYMVIAFPLLLYMCGINVFILDGDEGSLNMGGIVYSSK
jgi:hypothetical protein